MDAIEIYQKILEIAKDQDFNDVNTAMNFARSNLETEHYSTQKSAYIGGGLAGVAALGQYNPQEEAYQIVRKAVREELDAQKALEAEAQ